MPLSFRAALMGTALAATLALSCPAVAQDSPDLDRAAQGVLSEKGGARRLKGDMTDQLRALIQNGEVRNVILLIGDGMGDSEITVARNYAKGAGGFFEGIDALPITGQYTHYSLDRETGKPDYVTDSAASASEWSTGVKTYNGAISVDIHGQPHPTLLKLAKEAGYATGDVSTAAIQDATPAAQVAHVLQRKCYSPSVTAEKCAPNALENGGAGSISEQLLDTRPDVTLGGGSASFAEKARAGKWAGKTLFEQAEKRGYTIVRNAAALDTVTQADQEHPLLGLFSDDNMPTRWTGPRATYHGNLDDTPVRCSINPERTSDIPKLAAMTSKAIDLLKTNPKGFFLQVEGASIDKQDHQADPCGQIGETVDLDEAVQVALNFAKTDGHTLVIVTADHAHTSQIIANDSKSPGLTRSLITADDAVMTVNYATAEVGHQGHTGTQLRVAAYGPYAANFAGLTDQSDMFFTISEALKLEQ